MQIHEKQILPALSACVDLAKDSGSLDAYAQKVVALINKPSASGTGFYYSSKKDSNLPFSFRAIRTSLESVDLHFIMPSSLQKPKQGGYKKIKDLFSVTITAQSSPDEAILPKNNILARIELKKWNRIEKNLTEIHRIILQIPEAKKYFTDIWSNKITLPNKKSIELIYPRYEKKNFSERLQKEPKMSLKERIRHSLHIAQGICLLQKHSPVIIHGDLKEDNVLMEIKEGKEEALINDFDLTCLYTQSLKKSHQEYPFFPSIRRNGYLHPQMDLYSLIHLIGISLLSDYRSFFASFYFKKSFAKDLQQQMGEGFLIFNAYKKQLSPALRYSLETIFLKEKFHLPKVVEKLLAYANRFEEDPKAALIREIAFELAIFPHIFPLILKNIEEDLKVADVGVQADLYCPPSINEVIFTLEKSQETLASIEKDCSSKPSEDLSNAKQFIDPFQIQELVKKTLKTSDLKILMNHTEHLAANINEHLKAHQEETWQLRFFKNTAWGAGHLLPFSGWLRKEPEKVILCLIPNTKNTWKHRDSQENKKGIFFAEIPLDSQTIRKISALSGVCIRQTNDTLMFRENYAHVEKLQKRNLLLNTGLSAPSFFQVYCGKNKGKTEFYDLWGESIFLNHFCFLNVKWALEIFLQVLSIIESLHANHLTHGNIRPENIIIKKHLAKLANFHFLGPPEEEETSGQNYRYWDPIALKGKHSFATDLYGFLRSLEDKFFFPFNPDKLDLSDLVIKKLATILGYIPSEHFVQELEEVQILAIKNLAQEYPDEEQLLNVVVAWLQITFLREELKNAFDKKEKDRIQAIEALALQRPKEAETLLALAHSIQIISPIGELLEKVAQAETRLASQTTDWTQASENDIRVAFVASKFPTLYEIKTVLQNCLRQSRTGS
jgi:serine/threonine protein kinase